MVNATDPVELEKIKDRELGIVRERVQMLLDAGANVVLTTKVCGSVMGSPCVHDSLADWGMIDPPKGQLYCLQQGIFIALCSPISAPKLAFVFQEWHSCLRGSLHRPQPAFSVADSTSSRWPPYPAHVWPSFQQGRSLQTLMPVEYSISPLFPRTQCMTAVSTGH